MFREDLLALSLSDEELLGRLRRNAKSERRIQAQFLAYLAVVEKRRLFALEGYTSLFAFVVQSLGYSEATALKRIQVARKAIRFPRIYECLVEARVSLTGLSKLSPYLTEANHELLLNQSSGKSVTEIENIIVAHFPKAAVKDSVRNRVTPLSVDQVHVNFSASKAFAEKVKKAKALLSHKYPQGRLEDIFGEALDLLLQKHEPKEKRSIRNTTVANPNNRYLPQAVRNEVRKRDGDKCSYISPEGHACDATHFLEFDHVFPWALGGEHESRNVRLLCRTHNRLSAEIFFGSKWMEQVSSSRARDSWEVRRGRNL